MMNCLNNLCLSHHLSLWVFRINNICKYYSYMAKRAVWHRGSRKGVLRDTNRCKVRGCIARDGSIQRLVNV